MAKKKLIIPKLAAEVEDARWHDRHRRELERALERRIGEGSTLTPTAGRPPPETAACDHPAGDRRH